ncbi:MAG TPA: DsbA family oxidoreductase [Acetobacteraceae bacterium]|jgi:predicted DsbA family dithiol-disulfide isomerase|nr:DsbA family oxidoreductase [Acetobacteraceae bacterium]
MDAITHIAVVSDAICPWCYIGKRQLERALPMLEAEGMRFAVEWLPYQLNPDMPAGGLPRAEYRARKFGTAERGKQLDARVTDAAAAVGLPFRTDLITRTPNTVAAHRLAWFAHETEPTKQDAVVEALFRAYFVEGRNIEDQAVLLACAAEAGLDATSLLAGDEGRAEVLAQDGAARGAGLDGVPTFVMNRHVLFSGAMPAADMAEAFRRAWAVLGKQAA